MNELPAKSIEKLARVTKLLRTQRTLPAKLETVVALAKETVPNRAAAGISLVIEGEPTTAAYCRSRWSPGVAPSAPSTSTPTGESAFDAHSEEVARPLADHAAGLISTSPLYAYSLTMVEDLVESLEAQALIGQASGVIMANEQRTSEAALDRLRELAMGSGESLRTVARWVIEERPTAAGTVTEDGAPAEGAAEPHDPG